MRIIARVKPFLPFLLTLAAGCIAAFAMPPAGWWPCLFIGLSVLFCLWLKTGSYRAAFFTGFLFGIGYFTTGLWWIGNALLIEGNEFWWVWPISVIGLPALLSFFTGFFCALARVFLRGPRLSSWIGFAVFLTLSEWIRGHIFTGFPWNLYGYAWNQHVGMLQGASVFGAYSLTFLTAAAAAAPGMAWAARKDIPRAAAALAVSLIILAGLYGYGQMRLAQPTIVSDETAVRVVQANIPQTAKWDTAQTIPIFEKHLAHSAKEDRAQSLFILWPETAIPPVLVDNAHARQQIGDLLALQADQAYLLTGALVHKSDEAGSRYYNALLAYDQTGSVQASYAKTHLVPFGEFIPFQQWIPIRPVVRFQGFERGDGPSTLRVGTMPGFSPLICYEIIFPGQVADRADRPDMLVAVTNDGWYGDSAGPHQHFFQVRVRSIEEGLPAIRSANTGISGIVDPYGRILAKSELFDEISIDSPLPLPVSPPLFARTGNLFWFGVLLLICAACALRQKIRA